MPHGSPSLAGSLVTAGAAALALLSGCSYTSTYRAPNDGRARVVWAGSDVVALAPEVSETCGRRVEQLTLGEVVRSFDMKSHRGYWRPEEEADEAGGGEVDVQLDGGGDARAGRGGHHRGRGEGRGHHGGARGASARGGAHGGGHGGGSLRVSGGGRSGGGGSIGGRSSGGGGGGGAGGKGGGAAAAVVLVLLYLVMPVTAIVWSEVAPGDDAIASNIDRANAYNDLVRSGDDACGGEP